MTNSLERAAPPAANPFALSQATWTQTAAHERRVVIVPLGSVEQHGPHLPLDTDTRIAVAVARGAAAGYPGAALAPPVAFGASGEHDGFPGTLSIGTGALTKLLVELGRDASRHWGALLIVNAHGGNRDAVRAALARLDAEGRRCAVFSVAPASGGAGEGVACARDAHAGRTETSMLLHLDPSAVRSELAQPGESRPLEKVIGRIRDEGVRAVSPTGVLGDPRGATAEEGRRLLAELVAGCRSVLDALLVPVAAGAAGA